MTTVTEELKVDFGLSLPVNGSCRLPSPESGAGCVQLPPAAPDETVKQFVLTRTRWGAVLKETVQHWGVAKQ